MMAMYIYVLFNKENKLYVGITNTLEHRVRQHNKGHCKSTCSYKGQWKLLHSWKTENYIVASKLERYLHTLKDWKILDIIANHTTLSPALKELFIKLPTTPFETKKLLESLCKGLR